MAPRTYYRLRCIYNVLTWIRPGATHKEWDEILWSLLEDNEIKLVGIHKALIGEYMVWIANSPYASGTIIINGKEYFCSRATALFLRDELKVARLLQKLKGPYDKASIMAKTGIIL